MKKDFVSIADLSADEVWNLLHTAKEIKAKTQKGEPHTPLAGQTLTMIFQKPSLRTRVSFEVGMYQLGGTALYLSPNEIRIGERESVADVARVLSRYCNGLMARLFAHSHMLELARYATVPVINGLDDLFHPCQVMGDILTIWEHRETLDDLKVAWVGDGNNVANSWINLASKIPMVLHLAVPEGYDPDPDVLKTAEHCGTSEIRVLHDPQEAVKGADVIYTDVWTSMGHEAEQEERAARFQDFQVNDRLVGLARKGVKVMHCLPAHRGEEITDEVMDGPHSIVFDQAENRLHIQKAIMAILMG
ncbi:MAG: ornithine carbamoyltransferase [Gemmatimonadota bacterium]|nr:MAG: ornithine carbamoyltransferase [Gemmatimonadota bacterium]